MNIFKKKTVSLKTYAIVNFVIYGLFVIIFVVMEFVFASKENEWGTALTMAIAAFLVGKAIWCLKTKREKNDELSRINCKRSIASTLTILSHFRGPL